jgi:hypothetical protein
MKALAAATLAVLLGAAVGAAQQATSQATPAQAEASPAASANAFQAGRPLGVTVDGKFTPLSSNVKVYGSIISAESCSYDATRDLIMVVNRGAAQSEAPNDGFVSLLNHDGSVHTAKWIGQTRDGLVLNQPFGSDVHSGRLYLADSDGDTRDGMPRTAVIRLFDIATGAPAGEIRVPQVQWFNDIAVAEDGAIYATQTGSADGQVPMRVYKITREGNASIFLDGSPLSLPNGIGVQNDGNVVVLNMGDDRVMTFSPAGRLIKTEHAAQAGSDGLVILEDGAKYVSSVRNGGVSRLSPGRSAELIATGIPNAASMCYDKGANQLVIPMNPNNAVAMVKLDGR